MYLSQDTDQLQRKNPVANPLNQVVEVNITSHSTAPLAPHSHDTPRGTQHDFCGVLTKHQTNLF